MPELLSALKTDEAKQFLELRRELSKTSTAKFEKMLACACSDDHARGLFQFYGANRTGRFAGRLLQLQNLPQNHLEDIEETRALVRAGSYDELREKHKDIASTLSELIRTAIIPEPGCQFLVADFSAIEARVIAWLAGEKWRLDVFRDGGDIYCASASQIFGVPVVKNGVNGHLRQRGKVAELALGYGGGVSAMRQMDTARALINESDEEIKKIVTGWRASSPRITALWYALENAAKKSIRLKRSVVSEVGNIRFDYDAGNLVMYLPSGRPLVYVNAEIGTNKFGNSSILYAGTNQKTHKWEMLETYGGKLSENLTQATARDCLRECMLRLDAEGYDLRMHVHDEVIINEPKGGRTVDDVIDIMRQPPKWAEDMPLNAAGFSSDFYMKD
jgi:DNA polymerase